ncbi:hypothetical protein LPUS_03887 [Lasallia pustulata]|uniref:Uncharacterized protein n=1 Tax=Lasallia pustulata TaxID=136370 RepID=A0A1W5CVN0_9LECA|nr:hypothetical protein LPUS_03887 [Lasallia pustulata]
MDNTPSYHFKGNQLDSDEEDAVGTTSLRWYQELRQAKVSTPLRNHPNGASQAALANLAKAPMSQSIGSSVESVDGYDSFENTNNKKKRKIPTSGALGTHQSSLSAEMANMGISSARDMDPSLAELDAGVGQYHGTGTSAIPATPSGIGISGAGRGRYGRTARNVNGRSPLGVSINSSNAWQSGRSGPRRDYTPSGPPGTKDNILNQTPAQGIISAAIANAAALQTTSTKGQENASCLSEQQSARKSTPAKTQFTFICESDSAKGMNWPVQHSPNSVTPHHTAPPPNMPAQAAQGQRGFSTQGRQTSPDIASQPSQNRQQQQAGSNQQAPQQEKKPRRPPGKQYAMAARERRLQQDSNNYHHPPSGEDVWICEFCEYESIFGSPPEALVRQYEIKDRRERRRLAEKRRLLEKAKLKGRKGKKGNKNANNAAKNATANATAAAAAAATLAHPPAAAAAAAPQQQRYDPQTQPQPADQPPMQQHQGTQSEDYLADDYDDDPVPVPAPPPSKIPQPVGQRYGQTLRSAAGYGTVHVGAGGGAA